MIFRIFISCVQCEFSAERKALAEFIRSDAILSKFFEVFIFEEVPAQDRPAAGVYFDEVDNCDIYLGLHGGEYGNVDKKGVSATQREYERAEKAQKQRMCFIRKAEVTDARQREFLSRIDEDVVRNGFSDYEELKTAVYAALACFLESRNMDTFQRTGKRIEREVVRGIVNRWLEGQLAHLYSFLPKEFHDDAWRKWFASLSDVLRVEGITPWQKCVTWICMTFSVKFIPIVLCYCPHWLTTKGLHR